jgi:hypothetical protein
MARNIIKLGDIIKLYSSILVHIKFIVGLSDDSLACFIQISSDGPQELIEIYLAISISIKV